MPITRSRFRTFGFICLTAASASLAKASPAPTWLAFSPQGGAPAAGDSNAIPPSVQVRSFDRSGLDVFIELKGLSLTPESNGHGEFVRVSLPGEPENGEVGGPTLPVVRRIFRAPADATIEVQVSDGPVTTVSLAEAGFSKIVYPHQPIARASDEDIAAAPKGGPAAEELPPVPPAPFQYAPTAYDQNPASPAELATATKLGRVRGQDLYLLEVRPIAYDFAAGRLTVRTRLDVRVRWSGAEFPADARLPVSGWDRVILNPPSGAPRGPRSVNFLIVTAQDFAGSAPLTQFANAKTAQGFNVMIYTAAPGTHRDTIKAYIQNLWGTPDSPDYLMIVGDAEDYTAAVDPTAVGNTIPAFVGGGACHWVTDLPYVCMDGADDWYADIPFGRVSVRLVSELQAAVDKMLYVESGNYADASWTTRAIFTAGAPEYDVEGLLDEVIARHMTPNGVQSTRLYPVINQVTTQDEINAYNSGAFLATYFGHSFGFQAWSRPYFNIDHVAGLTNQDMYPFVIVFCCTGGAFHYHEYHPGMIEEFMRGPNRGGIGGYGCTGSLGYEWSTWANLYRFLTDAIYLSGSRELGPAAQTAIARFITYYGANSPVSRDYAEGWEYFGDPSLALPNPPRPNYLIVSAPNYVNTLPLNQFIAWKQGRGLQVSVYNVPSGTSNTLIRNYIHSLWGTVNQPSYIMLVGDTSGSTSTAATIPHFVGGGSKAAATDLPYGCMGTGDDWYPEIPVGRFPVQTTAQLQVMVDKVLKVESGSYPDPNYTKRGAFLANADTYNTAEPTHDWVINNYFTPNGYTGIKIYAAQGGNTTDITNAVNSGCLWAVYMGHSDQTGWWSPAFNQANVNSLANSGLYGVVFGWSCNTAHYDLTTECFGETWVRAANKGAAAYISASNYIYWGSAAAWLPSGIHEKSFFASFFEDNIWEVGPAWRAGLYRFLRNYGGWDGDPSHPPSQNLDVCRNFFEEFVLLGDPSMQLPSLHTFAMTIDPPSRNVCVPGTTQATYTIEVRPAGSFSEVVTLSVNGQPTGATVNFDLNGQIPPYTSTLTIANLDSVASGQYALVVTGTSSSTQRSAPAQLGISDSLPGGPGLLTPANGATGVPRLPLFTWTAASGAFDYRIQVATDSAFSNPTVDQIVPQASYQCETQLAANTLYYWRVSAENGCGSTTFTSPFSFTTLQVTDYFTEEFGQNGGGSFDLGNRSLTFTPTGSGSLYLMCKDAITALPTDPTGGTNITSWNGSSDDGYALITLTGGHTVALYGTTYGAFYVGTNGFITFGSGDTTWTQSLSAHFSKPRISAVFDDLNPGSGGSVSWKALPDRVAVTWLNVPEYPSTGSNTFQIELYYDGKICVSWLAIGSSANIVGLSRGTGIPSDFTPTDLSAAPSCSAQGACCIAGVCSQLTNPQCLAAGGTYQGDSIPCTPNPCINYDPSCLIISEVVQGAESGGCPRWIEITNTGPTDFVFLQGGIIVQTDLSNDVNVDISLAGVTIAAGQSYVVESTAAGACEGAFYAIYQQMADLSSDVTFGFGNERFILTDTANGSHLLDIYGEFGVSGTGKPWEFTNGYSYRLPNRQWACQQAFAPEQWHFGGVGSLAGPDPTGLLRSLTTPGTHVYTGSCSPVAKGDLNCDGAVNIADIQPFVLALLDEAAYYSAYPTCQARAADMSNDCRFDGADIEAFVSALLQP